jgi:hypothetical protein
VLLRELSLMPRWTSFLLGEDIGETRSDNPILFLWKWLEREAQLELDSSLPLEELVSLVPLFLKRYSKWLVSMMCILPVKVLPRLEETLWRLCSLLLLKPISSFHLTCGERTLNVKSLSMNIASGSPFPRLSDLSLFYSYIHSFLFLFLYLSYTVVRIYYHYLLILSYGIIIHITILLIISCNPFLKTKMNILKESSMTKQKIFPKDTNKSLLF